MRWPVLVVALGCGGGGPGGGGDDDALVETRRFVAPHPSPSDELGISVGVSDDATTIAIGAYGEDSAATGIGGDDTSESADGSGAAFVVEGDRVTYVKAGTSTAGDRFGQAVAIARDGSTLAIGATGDDGTIRDSGAVYVFRRAADTWQQEAYLKASDASTDALFGASVALSGDGNTLAIGAVPSAVYVFERSGTAWTETSRIASLVPSDAAGSALALSGDGATLAVSRPGFDARRGSVDILVRDGATWSVRHSVMASNADADDNFGYAVALSADGSVLAASAVLEASATGDPSDNTAISAGAVYVFVDGSELAYLKPDPIAATAIFGFCVALTADGSRLAIGAPLEAGTGASYVFDRSAAGYAQVARLTASTGAAGARFGHSIGLHAGGAALVIAANLEVMGAGAVYVLE